MLTSGSAAANLPEARLKGFNEFRVWGFKGLGFRGLGFRGLGFSASGLENDLEQRFVRLGISSCGSPRPQ